MKILTKSLLITATALASCGLVFTVAGGIMGGNIGSALVNMPVRVETKGEVRTVPDRDGRSSGSNKNGGSSRSGGNDRSGGSDSYGSGGYGNGGYGNGGYGSDIDEFYRKFFGDDFDIFGDFFGDGYGNGYDGGNGGGGRSNLEYF